MKHYVYIHFTKDELRPFYIGKGTKDRSIRVRGRNIFWKRTVEKHGFVVDYLEYFDTHEEALNYEVKMIAFFRSEGVNLTNMTDGGEGCCGILMSAHTKQRIREANLGNKHRLGHTPSEYTKGLLSALNKGKKLRPKTVEEREVLANLSRGNTNRRLVDPFILALIDYLSDAKQKEVAQFLGLNARTIRRYNNHASSD